MDYRKNIKSYIEKEIETLQRLDVDAIDAAVNAIMAARERGGNIYTMGNGGSAATASHMVCDFARGASDALGGKKFKFECLSDNIPTLMAIANDFCYEEIFVHQLRGKLKAEDLVIAISGSGNSENVIRAVSYAKEIGTPVIGISGYSGGKLKQLCDYSMHVPVDNMQIAEDLHMMFDHLMMTVVQQGE